MAGLLFFLLSCISIFAQAQSTRITLQIAEHNAAGNQLLFVSMQADGIEIGVKQVMLQD